MQNIEVAVNTLKFFRTSTVRTPLDMIVHKVSTRWVQASMETEYDMLIRLQYLEGVAHVKESTWSRLGGVRGILAAKKVFADKFQDTFHQIDPSWWDVRSTHAYRVLAARTQRTLARFKIFDMEPLDIINMALMGIPVQVGDPTLEGRLRPAYQLGLKHGDEIFAGQTPDNMAATGLSKAMFRRILDYAKSKGSTTRVREEDEEGVAKEYAIKDSPGVSLENFMSSLMFGPTSDPLANKVQETMKSTWANNSIIDNWFGTIQMSGEVPQANEFALQMGISPQSLGQRHLKPGLERAVRAIWNNVPLRKAIEERMIQENVQGDLPDTLVSITKQPDHIKVASSYMLRSILASYPAWLIRHAGKKIR